MRAPFPPALPRKMNSPSLPVMKMLLHLFYVCCAIVPVLLNFGICFASYRWHLQFRAALARELEQIRARR